MFTLEIHMEYRYGQKWHFKFKNGTKIESFLLISLKNLAGLDSGIGHKASITSYFVFECYPSIVDALIIASSFENTNR